MLQDVNGVSLSGQAPGPHAHCQAQVKADITNQSWYSSPMSPRFFSRQDHQGEELAPEGDLCPISTGLAPRAVHAALILGAPSTSRGSNCPFLLPLPPLPHSPHTHLVMNRASEWRQATKRPLMISIFLAVD